MKYLLFGLLGLCTTVATKAQNNFLWTWGSPIGSFYNINNFYGTNFQNPWPFHFRQPVPIISPGGEFVHLCAAGASAASAGVRSDGSLWRWQNNGNPSLAPDIQRYGNDNNWKLAGFSNSGRYAIKTDGTLWNILDTVPQQIGTDNQWVDLKGGMDHMIGLKSNGTIWRWTNNTAGVINRNPTQIGTDNNWAKIDAINQNSGGIKTDGSIWLWGNAQRDTLPVRVGTANDWRDLSVIASGLIAIKNNGTLWSMGSLNYAGQLGQGNSNTSAGFVQIGTDSNWSQIASGEANVYAIKTDQSLWAWGANNFRQLGDSSTTDRLAPVRIGNANNWLKIEASTLHAIALRNTGFLLPNISSVFAEEMPEGMLLYPNPASNVLFFQLANEVGQQTYSIFDLHGKRLLQGEITAADKSVKIDFLAKGVYLLFVETPNRTYWQRFLKH
ncbi:MAG: hypothetical protein C0424_04560 [Sphingobacteriaceae bacterium]|nr:hypothetical protein [Sphingobacteriaceae bacterium]